MPSPSTNSAGAAAFATLLVLSSIQACLALSFGEQTLSNLPSLTKTHWKQRTQSSININSQQQNIQSFISSTKRLSNHFEALQAGAGDVSATCFNAVVLTYNALQSCSVEAENLFANATPEATEAFCNADVGNCPSDLRASFQNILTTCTPSEVGHDLVHNIRDLVVGHINAVCVQHDDKYCLPHVVSLIDMTGDDDVSAGDDGITQDVLEQFCEPCVAKFLRAVSVLSDDEDGMSHAVFSIMCIKHEGEFCMLRMQEMFGDFEEDSNPFCSPDICHPCTRKLFGAVASADSLQQRRKRRRDNDGYDDSAPTNSPLQVDNGEGETETQTVFRAIGMALRAACSVDENGQRCIESAPECQDQESVSSSQASDPCENAIEIGTCPAACKAEVESFVAEQGCCLATRLELIREFVDEFGGEDETSAEQQIDEIVEFAEDVCGVDLPDVCASLQANTIDITVSFDNVVPEYAEDNLEQICDAAAMDLVSHLGLLSSTWQRCSWDSATSSLTIVMNIPVDGAQSLSEELQADSDAGLLSWPALESELGADSRADPLAELGVEVAETTLLLEGSDGSSDDAGESSHVQASMVGMIAACLAAAFM